MSGGSCQMDHSVIVSLELLYVCSDFIGLFDHVYLRHPWPNVDWYPWLTPWSLLDEHLDRHAVDTLLTLDNQWVGRRPNVDWLLCIDQKWINCWPRCQQSVDQVLNKMSIRGINRQSPAGAVNTHDPVCLQKRLPIMQAWGSQFHC